MKDQVRGFAEKTGFPGNEKNYSFFSKLRKKSDVVITIPPRLRRVGRECEAMTSESWPASSQPCRRVVLRVRMMA